MDVLQTMRANGTCLEPLQAYELWHDTGSQSAYNALNQDKSTEPRILSKDTSSSRH